VGCLVSFQSFFLFFYFVFISILYPTCFGMIFLGDLTVFSAGVEAISPSPEGEMNFQAHNICGERKMTHMEGLDNLDKVVGKGRFTFVGFPLKLRGGSGSPIRAVALLDR
jgi:kynurenine formamidase